MVYIYVYFPIILYDKPKMFYSIGVADLAIHTELVSERINPRSPQNALLERGEEFKYN